MTWPRTIRPTEENEKNEITPIATGRLGPITDTSAMANTRYGSDSTTSMKRDSTVSTTLPK